MKVKLKEIFKKNAKSFDLNIHKSYKVLQNRHNLMYSIKGESGNIHLYPCSSFDIVEK